MLELFLKHPRAVGETYAEHFLVAFVFGSRMVAGGLACIVHAVFPALFERTASLTVLALHTKMTSRRRSNSSGELDYAI